MKKLVLKSNKPTEENILAIINYVRELERDNGLSDEEISYKYTHGDCTCLATLIKEFLPKVTIYLFEKDLDSSHYCVGIKGNIEKDSKLEESELFYPRHGSRYYYDINGKKYYEEMCSFIETEYDSKSKDHVNCRPDGCNTDNDVTCIARKNIVISSINDDLSSSIQTKTVEENNNISLNDIIKINEKLLQEFMLSQLSEAQKAKNYVKQINEIIKIYKEYVIKTPDWRTRLTEVNEFLQTIPFFYTYRYNDSIDRNMNHIAELEYYRNIAMQIYEYIESLKNEPRKL